MIKSGSIQEPVNTWKEPEMDYLSDRARKLIDRMTGVPWEREHKDFINEIIEVLEDCATVIDDLVDAVDELDMRLSELEEKFETGDNPE